MNPIRPTALPPSSSPQVSTGADAARAAAQKAFFDAAMGRAPAPARTAPVSVTVTATPVPQRVELRPSGETETPTRILRPGSLLDIRV